MFEVHIQCEECRATCVIQHHLHPDSYEVMHVCPFCGSEEVEVETEEK
jgi:Zn finger protein HypA/HybF involved in hydrogenase expression